jgi:hypothetical protein
MCSKLSYIYIKNNSSRSATDKIKPIIELAVRQVNFIALRCAFFSCAERHPNKLGTQARNGKKPRELGCRRPLINLFLCFLILLFRATFFAPFSPRPLELPPAKLHIYWWGQGRGENYKKISRFFRLTAYCFFNL